jgi:hypothetical protein
MTEGLSGAMLPDLPPPPSRPAMPPPTPGTSASPPAMPPPIPGTGASSQLSYRARDPWPGAVGGHAPADKSVGLAYVLWFFLGVFGAHQFYLGKIGRGVGYLLTFAWLTIGLWIDLFTLPAQIRAVNAQRRAGLR